MKAAASEDMRLFTKIPALNTVIPSIPGGKTPTMSMPGTTINSLTCCTANSTSPRATSSAVKPLAITVAFARTTSAIPSRSSSPAKNKPLAPAPDIASDFAAISVATNASTVEISAPRRPRAHRNPDQRPRQIGARRTQHTLMHQRIDSIIHENRDIRRLAGADTRHQDLRGEQDRLDRRQAEPRHQLLQHTRQRQGRKHTQLRRRHERSPKPGGKP